MLFKLVSNGHTTHVEIDGKMVGPAVTGVTFSHTGGSGKERVVTAQIDLDLACGDTTENYAFRDTERDEFIDIIRKYEENEKTAHTGG